MSSLLVNKVPSDEEAAVYVNDLDVFVTMMLLLRVCKSENHVPMWQCQKSLENPMTFRRSQATDGKLQLSDNHERDRAREGSTVVSAFQRTTLW